MSFVTLIFVCLRKRKTQRSHKKDFVERMLGIELLYEGFEH